MSFDVDQKAQQRDKQKHVSTRGQEIIGHAVYRDF